MKLTRPARRKYRMTTEILEARLVLDSTVVFNEILYNPSGINEQLEFVELHNQMVVDLDISSWTLDNAIDYQFPEGTVVSGGGYLVVAKDPQVLREIHNVDGVLGPYEGQLANEGDTIELRDRNERLMDQLAYGDSQPWPDAADGSGVSLAKIDPRTTSDDADHWSSSVFVGGTPGQTNFPTPETALTVQPLITEDDVWARFSESTDPGPGWHAQANDDPAWTESRAPFFAGDPFGTESDLELIVDVEVEASSELSGFDRKAAYLVDGSGLDRGRHGITPDGSMWLNQGTFGGAAADLEPEVTFDLGRVRAVEQMKVWNYNEDLPNRPELRSRGVSSADILVAGEDQQFRLLIENQPFEKGPGRETDFAQIIDLGGAEARFVKLDIRDNFPGGDNEFVGLSEVQFFSSPTLAGTELSAPRTTDYFRKSFQFEEDPTAAQLTLDATIDDGAAFYLNGQEVARHNLPDGPIGHETFAVDETVGSAQPLSISLPVDSLMEGVNVFAVEVHQAADGGHDMAFAASLTASITETISVGFEPVTLSINETAGADADSFWIELHNHGQASLDLEGYHISTSADAELTLSGQSLAPDQFLTVRDASLSSDLKAGDRVYVYNPDRTQVVAAARVDDVPRARLPDGTGPFLFPIEVSPGEPNRVPLQDAIVINEIMYNAPSEASRQAIPPTVEDTQVVPYEAEWRHSKPFTFGPNDLPLDLGSEWAGEAHDVDLVNWFTGPGPFGFPAARRPVRVQTAITNPAFNSNYITTYYFESGFTLSQSEIDSTDQLLLNQAVDDGAVFYINGQEVYRTNLPDGPLSGETLAAADVANLVLGESILVPKELLLPAPAENLLSVEVHQSSTDSDDVYFATELVRRRILTEGTPAVPFVESTEEWIELYNRSDQTVDVSGWELEDAVEYAFPQGTTLGPGDYLVVSNDSTALAAKYPDIADRVVGDFQGSLANRSDRIVLVDARGNPADQVEYYQDGSWPVNADGRGSSLELRSPDADNSSSTAWAASQATEQSPWQTVRYRGNAGRSVVGPDRAWDELVLGLLRAGEVLLDDVSVIEDPSGEAKELIQNGSFEVGEPGEHPDKWRLIGNHRHSEIIVDPADSQNQVLRFVATGPTEHMHNHAETTLKDGNEFVDIDNDQVYEISFRAQWVSGSNQLNSRLYFNRLPRTSLIERSDKYGTPGRQNSVFEANIGPTFSTLQHTPAVPDAGQPVRIEASAADPDGIASAQVWYSVDSGPFASVPMQLGDDGLLTGQLPGQVERAVVQFYIEARDANGQVSVFPRAGENSRALYQVEDGRAETNGLHNYRIVMTPDDAAHLHDTIELMSNDRLGATIIYNESEVFYNTRVRLAGSQRARPVEKRLQFNIKFNTEQLFRGVHSTMKIDRSESTGFGQREIIYHHGMNHAGGLPSEYNDLIHVISPQNAHTGPAELQLARYTDVFLESQFENTDEGRLYEYELIYYPTTTSERGNPESRKRPQPDSVVGTPIRDLGENKEDYRWNFLIKNNRADDNFDRFIDFAQAFGSSSDFLDVIDEYVDVDQWLRAFAFSTISGFEDHYGAGSQHNLQLYVRPSDQRVLFFPHDLDAFYDATLPLNPGGDLRKFTRDPQNEHMYYGHVHDMIQTTFNEDYMTRWTEHFGSLLPRQPFSDHLRDLVRRSDILLSQIEREAATVDFQITSEDLTASSIRTTVEGSGWINVREIRLAGSELPLNVTWNDVTSWSVEIPVEQGEHGVVFEAYDFQGNLIASDSVKITGSVTNPVQESLRITELNFNPGAPTPAELSQIPDVNNDDFEFVELQNGGESPIDLSGVRFVDGISFEFSDVTLLPGQRLVLASNHAAFTVRYGTDVQVFGEYTGRLRNSGEQLQLVDAGGRTIQLFTFSDDWYLDTDGAGRTLIVVDPQGDFNLASNWRPSPTLSGTPTQPEAFLPQPGDANFDRKFNQLDIILALQGAKYLTEEDALWSEGDWNGDGVFDPLDIVAALQTGLLGRG